MATSFFENFRNTIRNSEDISQKIATSTPERKSLKNKIIDYFQYSSPDDEHERTLDEDQIFYKRTPISYFPFTLSRQGDKGMETQAGILMANTDGYIIGAQLDNGESLTPNGAKSFLNDAKNSGWVFDMAEQGSVPSNDNKEFLRNKNYDDGYWFTDSNPISDWHQGAKKKNGEGPFSAKFFSKEMKEKVKPAMDFILNYRNNRGL